MRPSMETAEEIFMKEKERKRVLNNMKSNRRIQNLPMPKKDGGGRKSRGRVSKSRIESALERVDTALSDLNFIDEFGDLKEGRHSHYSNLSKSYNVEK